MIRPITYDKQLIKSKDHALVVSQFYAGRMGILTGCALTHDAENVYVAPGYFITCGRLTRVEATETIPVPLPASGIRYCVLVWDIDLSQVPENVNTPQVSWRVLQAAGAYPKPTQEDLFANPTSGRYQQEFARFTADAAGVSTSGFTTVIKDIGTPEDLLVGYEQDIELAVSSWTKVNVTTHPQFASHATEYVSFWPALSKDPIPKITPYTTATARLAYADAATGLPEPNDGVTMDGRIAFFLTTTPKAALHLTVRFQNGYIFGGLM